jgi:hypothetical protein
MTNTFILTLLIFSFCSSGQTNGRYYSQNQDTIYSTTTKQLKSNNIPERVFGITTLKYLTITGMDCDYGDNTKCWDITKIPSQIKYLKNLTTLCLNVNAIQNIPIELSELKNLKTIDLSDNLALSSVDNIENIFSLEYLFLYGCGLTRLPDRIDKLKNLKELGLAGNHIDKREQARIRKALPNCIIKF